MLQLKLDELIDPRLVAAFKEQWNTDPEIAAAEARDVIRALTSPMDERERVIGKIINALVGPSPDAFAWIEALTTGSFKIPRNVSYAVGRTGESPTKFFVRQRDRINDIVGHGMSQALEAEYRNAYEDALRLVVASALLTQMRKNVSASAAVGAGWPLMTAVTAHCDAQIQAKLACWGSTDTMQRELAAAVAAIVAHHEATIAVGDETWKQWSKVRRQLTQSAISEFFAADNEADHDAEQAKDTLLPGKTDAYERGIPSFLGGNAKKYFTGSSQWARLHLLMPVVGYAPASSSSTGSHDKLLVGAAMRSIIRTRRREAAIRDGVNFTHSEAFHVEACIHKHVTAGGAIPWEVPDEYVGFLEEEVAHSYDRWGTEWVGYRVWKKAGYLQFPATKCLAAFVLGLYEIDQDWTWESTEPLST